MPIESGSSNSSDILGLIRKQGLLAIQGELDWQYGQGMESQGMPDLGQEERDYLTCLPQVLSFQMAQKKGMAFFGKYLQDLPGFSDFEPFALEINMVCGLTRFLRDETVFPAVEAMAPQFEAEIIAFSQSKEWGHWTL